MRKERKGSYFLSSRKAAELGRRAATDESATMELLACCQRTIDRVADFGVRWGISREEAEATALVGALKSIKSWEPVNEPGRNQNLRGIMSREGVEMMRQKAAKKRQVAKIDLRLVEFYDEARANAIENGLKNPTLLEIKREMNEMAREGLVNLDRIARFFRRKKIAGEWVKIDLLVEIHQRCEVDLGDQVPAPDCWDGSDPEEMAYLSLLADQLEGLLETLTPREETVIRLRYFKDETLEEVAWRLEVTRARVRQIEAKAMRKLRHPSRRSFLTGYFK